MLLARGPQCTACLRRMFTFGLENKQALSRQQQTRGKKKTAKPSSDIKVKLLKGVSGYGPEGAIIAVAAGHMRDLWYPMGTAQYITGTQLRELKVRNIKVERDTNYRHRPIKNQRKQEGSTENTGEGLVNVQSNLLSPERSVQVLSLLLPPHIDFYRSPITAAAPEVAISHTPTSSQDASSAKGSKSTSQPAITGIYGSVSTADIALSIKTLLAESEEGSRIVLTPDDITLGIDLSRDENGEERLKQLGDFEIEINLKGASEGVSRVVRVLPQE